MRTHRNQGLVTQGEPLARSGTASPGLAGDASVARTLPRSPDLAVRTGGVDGTPRPRTQALPCSEGAGRDLSAPHRRAEATQPAGAVEQLAAQRVALAQRLAESTRKRRDTQVRQWLAESPAVARPARPGRPPADVDPAKVIALQDQLRHLDWQCDALAEDLASTATQLQAAQQRLTSVAPSVKAAPPEGPSARSSQAMTITTPATPTPPGTPTGAAAPGAVLPAELHAALRATLNTEPAHPASSGPGAALTRWDQAAPAGAARAAARPEEATAALSDHERHLVHQTLRHEGAAVTRLVRRMRLQEPRSRFDKVRAKVQKAPRPLEGARLQHFEGLVLKDIGALAKQGELSPPQATDLMRRAVHSRTLGASLSAPARDQLLLALQDARPTHTPGLGALPATPEGSPAQAGTPPRTEAINKLASGATLDLTDNHEASIATLAHRQVADLLAALGLGAPSEDELRFIAQKETAAALLKRPFSAVHNQAAARQASLGQDLPKDMLERLEKAAEIANAEIGVARRPNLDPHAPPQYKLEFRFHGSQDYRHAAQNLRTAVGGVGPVYEATDTVAEIMAHLVKEHGDKYQIGLVAGVSMGGGAAQAFLAGLESRTPLRVSPPMVLLDPQLLNDAQARAATRHGAYDFQKPRGVAISLDAPHKPRKGLMDIMKGPGGYRHPGLMQIRLGLTQGDGPDRGKNPGKPKSMPLGLGLHLGYHADEDQFARAIGRFTGRVGDLSAAGVEALLDKHDRRALSPQPASQSEITPASPRQGQQVGAAQAGSVSLRDRASTRALTGGASGSLRTDDPRAATAHTRTTLAELLAQEPPALPTAKPKSVAINKLNSGVKLDLSRWPDASIASLQPQELAALVQALRLGPPKSDEQELRAQKRQAKVLLEDFCSKLPALAAHRDAFHGPSAKRLMHCFPELTRRRLKAVAEIAHCKVHLSEAGGHGGATPPTLRLDIFFGAMENLRDVKQILKTAVGGRGPVYKAADELAAMLADGISTLQGKVEIGFVSSASLGGGTAQVFLAGLESRVQLPESPPLILLDPPLLNNTQSRHATRHGEIGYDFEKPRGIAITLDYTKDPHRGLVGIMKGPGGYKYPGLLHLRLGLRDTDGPNGGKPVASRLGMGYHGDGNLFMEAIRRFTSKLEDSPPSSFREPLKPQDGPDARPAVSLPFRAWGQPGIGEE